MSGAGGAGQVVSNERYKLAATTLNNIAMAVLGAGLVLPAVSGQMTWGQWIVGLYWAIAALALHGCAQFLLGRLR